MMDSLISFELAYINTNHPDFIGLSLPAFLLACLPACLPASLPACLPPSLPPALCSAPSPFDPSPLQPTANHPDLRNCAHGRRGQRAQQHLQGRTQQQPAAATPPAAAAAAPTGRRRAAGSPRGCMGAEGLGSGSGACAVCRVCRALGADASPG